MLAILAASLILFACGSGPNDAQISSDVKARFYASQPLKGTNVEVVSNGGVVTLSGEVPSDAARYEAFKLASDTPGVTKVNDKMTVHVAEAAPAPVEEAKPLPRPVLKPVAARPRPRIESKPEPKIADPAPVAAAPAAVQQQAPPAPPPVREEPPPPPQPKKITIESGTTLAVRMIDSVDSGVNQAGETFRASLDAPIDVDGEEVIPRGTDVTVRLAEAESAGRVMGRANLKLELAYLEYNGRRYTLQSSEVTKSGRSEGKRSAATIGGTAAVGAIIGAIAGGGKGAAIGTVAGAGAGTAASVITKGQQVKVPSETLLEFRLSAPFTVTVKPGDHNAHRSRDREPGNDQ
jgi:hypothetical protein